MADPYYNTSYGEGLEGVFNYSNSITDGWFANLFVIFIFIVTFTTLSKSEWKMNGVLAFCFFLTFITSMIMTLFMQVNPVLIYISLIGLAISVLAGILAKGR